jgi:F-type H+-transporting ATPase subunit b
VSRAWIFLPLVALLALSGRTVRADDHPTLTEPVSGSFDHEPSQSGIAPATGEPTHQPSHGETAAGHGEQGEHAGVDAKTLALQLLNFGVLLFILIWFGGRALRKAFRSRHDRLKTDIESAAGPRALAEQRCHEQDARLANLEQELAALRATVHEEGERERARLLAGAEEKAKRIQDETRFQLDQQVKEAEIRLRAEVASTAVKLADELLKRSVSPDDERRLAQDFAAGAGAPAEQAGVSR